MLAFPPLRESGITLFVLSAAALALPSIRQWVIGDMAWVWCSVSPRESLRKVMAGFMPDKLPVRGTTHVIPKEVGWRRPAPRSGNENKRFIILLTRVYQLPALKSEQARGAL